MDWLSQLVGIHYNFKGLLSGMGQDILRKWEASCWNPESEYLVANKLQNKCLQIVHFVLFMWQWNLKLTHQIHNYYSNRTTSGICAGRDIYLPFLILTLRQHIPMKRAFLCKHAENLLANKPRVSCTIPQG